MPQKNFSYEKAQKCLIYTSVYIHYFVRTKKACSSNAPQRAHSFDYRFRRVILGRMYGKRDNAKVFIQFECRSVRFSLVFYCAQRRAIKTSNRCRHIHMRDRQLKTQKHHELI